MLALHSEAEGSPKTSAHTVDFVPSIKSQLACVQLTSGPYVVRIWSRTSHVSGGKKPEQPTRTCGCAEDGACPGSRVTPLPRLQEKPPPSRSTVRSLPSEEGTTSKRIRALPEKWLKPCPDCGMTVLYMLTRQQIPKTMHVPVCE